MQPHEDEQIVTEHLMILQTAARALIAARRAVQRHVRESEARAVRLAQAAHSRRAAQSQHVQTEANRERAQRNKDVTQQHEREVLIARWAAAEAAREQAAAVADAWSERMLDAGIDPEQVKAAAAEIEAAGAETDNPAAATAAAERTAEQVQDVVVEQLAEEFVDQQLVQAAVIAAETALSEPEPGADLGDDNGTEADNGKSLTERLRGKVPDASLDAPFAAWKFADQTFAELVENGADPRELVDAARHCATGREAVMSMNDLVEQQKERAESAEIRRLIAATEVNRGTSAPAPETGPPRQPAHAGLARDNAVGVDL